MYCTILGTANASDYEWHFNKVIHRPGDEELPPVNCWVKSLGPFGTPLLWYATSGQILMISSGLIFMGSHPGIKSISETAKDASIWTWSLYVTIIYDPLKRDIGLEHFFTRLPDPTNCRWKRCSLLFPCYPYSVISRVLLVNDSAISTPLAFLRDVLDSNSRIFP